MRVLVTGGFGVNGAAVVRELLAHGHEPHVVDTRTADELVDDIVDRVPLHAVSVRDAEGLTQIFADVRPEVVVHTAAIIDADADPAAALDVNVTGSAVVLQAAAEAGARRVVHHSSRAVYGTVSGEHAHPSYVPIDEDYRENPIGLYDITKRATEDVARWFARRGSIEFVALRFSTILAPGKMARHGGFATQSSIIELPCRGLPVRVEQGGDERDDLIYIKDVASATRAAVEAAKPEHDAFNIATGTVRSLHDLAEAVRRHVPDADIEIGGGLDPMGFGVSYYSAMDSTRAATELGWTYEYGLDRLVEDYLNELQR